MPNIKVRRKAKKPRLEMRIEGKPVLNATKPVDIHITPLDIRTAKAKDPTACAAAKACVRELQATAAIVKRGRTYLKLGRSWFRFKTPLSLRSEIISFDRGGVFEPGEHTLLVPDDWRSYKPRGPHKAKGAKRRSYHAVAQIRDRMGARGLYNNTATA
jgi:hypothetical protein